MISGVIGLTRVLLDDNSLRPAGPAGELPIHIVFPITAARKSTFPIPKFPPPDVTGKGRSSSLLELRQQVIGFLRRNCFDRLSRSGGTLFPDRRRRGPALRRGWISGVRQESFAPSK